VWCRERAKVCGNLKKILANPIVTFPIKKRINTELFTDGKHALFTQETDQELLIGPLREVEKTGPHHTPRGNENQEQ